MGWYLSRSGAQVVFIDAGQPGEGVTGWTFSWVNASTKAGRRSYFDLNVAGMAAHRDLAGVIGPDSWWYPSGHLRWADDPADQARLLDTASLLASWDYDVEVRTGEEARSLEPALLIPDRTPVIIYPAEAWVHGPNLVARLVARAVESGAETRPGCAVRDIGTGSGGWSVRLSDGSTLGADAVVNAAGPGAAQVAAFVGRHLPMRREPGVVTRIACPRVALRRVVHAPRVAIRPDGVDSVVLHSSEVDTLIGGTDRAELAGLLRDRGRQVVPQLDGSGTGQTRVAERPIPGDGFPSVGAVASVPGYYEAVSHSGITLGPVIGRMLAAEITRGEPDALLANFRPDRFDASPGPSR